MGLNLENFLPHLTLHRSKSYLGISPNRSSSSLLSAQRTGKRLKIETLDQTLQEEKSQISKNLGSVNGESVRTRKRGPVAPARAFGFPPISLKFENTKAPSFKASPIPNPSSCPTYECFDLAIGYRGAESMLCDLLSRVLRFACRRVLGFLFLSFSSVMGCFLVCLRFKGDDGREKKSDAAVARNRLSSFFADEERGDNSADPEGNWVYGSPQIGKEIKDEARFLKACGTIPETPVEIRKAGEKLRMPPPSEVYSVTPRFHSWMPNTSLRNLWQDKQPSELLEGFEIDEESPEHAPISSCISNADNSKNTCVSSNEGATSGNMISRSKVIDEEKVSITTPFTPCPAGTSTQGGNRSVHFHHDISIRPPDDSLQGNASRGLKMKESIGTGSAMKVMPPPTPLKLSDEMQTPGTVFPANMENVQKRKVGIRSQYVYSVPLPNPPTNASQLKAPNEEISQHKQLSDHQEAKLEATLSNWLKPPGDKQPQFGRTYGERPILGLVATHWNEEEQLHFTPKLGGGNGIPNSTSKYQEDQKVCWHATPFEERLEKALSEENSSGNRSHFSRLPMTLEDDADSATSKLKSETRLLPC